MSDGEINYYRLGKQYASRPFDDPLWEDIPAMNYEQRLAFNSGYDDGLNSPSVGAKLFVSFLLIVALTAIFAWVK